MNASPQPKSNIQYEFSVCPYADIESTLLRMRAEGWHPVSHSIWHAPKERMTMASFIFKRNLNG